MALSLLMAALLAQVDVTSPPAASEPQAVHFRGAAELSGEAFPTGAPTGSEDFLAVVTPLIALDAGDSLEFELGANLRFHLTGDHQNDLGGILRGADWREPSDFGQIIRRLRIGSDDGPVQLHVGPLRLFTLGRGLVVSRYTNMTNPDYHPAGASLTAVIAAARATLFASDVLGARIFAGELSLDLGRAFSDNALTFDRYHAVLSLAQDFGRAGYVSPPVSLLDAELDAALFRGDAAQLFIYAAAGLRPSLSQTDAGGLIGVSVDGAVAAFVLAGKLELRHEGGIFRFGMFGPAYELSRFAAVGFSGPPVSLEQLPQAFSGYAEASLAWGAGDASSPAAPRIVLSAGTEAFAWGRVDLDVSAALRSLDSRGSALLRLTCVDLGGSPRYSVTGEARYRLWPSAYALASAGTVFFPQPDSTLVRGVYVGIGMGADFDRPGPP